MELDHVVVNVLGEMDAAAAQYSRLGFTLTDRGYHTLGSINHLAVFPDCYLELLGYATGEREKRAEMWVHPAGLTGLAFRTDDAATLQSAVQAAGVPTEAWKDFSRPVTVDGEEKVASFRTFQIDRSQVDNGRIFFCQHNTPELIWRPDWQVHANGAAGVAAFHFIAQEPGKVRNLLIALPGVGERLRAGRTRLVVNTPEQFAEEVGPMNDLPALAGGAMRMAGIDLYSKSLSETAAYLTTQGVPFRQDQATITLAPREALGLVLRFVG